MARVELRKARRYGLSLPVVVHDSLQKDSETLKGRTRDISARGVFFLIESEFHLGSEVNLTMTVPAEISVGGAEVFINVTGRVVRVEDRPEDLSKRIGVAATIDRYEMARRDTTPPQTA